MHRVFDLTLVQRSSSHSLSIGEPICVTCWCAIDKHRDKIGQKYTVICNQRDEKWHHWQTFGMVCGHSWFYHWAKKIDSFSKISSLIKSYIQPTQNHSSLPSEPVLTTTCFIFSKVSILSAEFGFFNAVEMSSLRLTVIKRAGPVCGGVFGLVLDRIRVRWVLELTLLDDIDLNDVLNYWLIEPLL